MWHHLQDLGARIDQWRFVANYEDLPEIVWDIWKCHRSSGTIRHFTGFLKEEIAQGERYISGLISIMPEGLQEGVDLKEWSIELAELFSKVHRSMAALQIRLEQVESGSVKKYPNILCPPHLYL